MKIIAFYLPQFHEIPENNEWWGKGFTEWTNTKKSKPLFNGHYQPREPYNDYYYNLLDEETRQRQAEVAEKYDIYGFCYYHYWFKGKKLLEKPIEEVLKLKSPKLHFCFSWANEPWARTWDGQDKDVLISQDYGDVEDWVQHFNYLLPFFKDERYIRVNNKPMFIIYRSSSISRCDEMLLKWQELAKKNGLDGIYFVKTLSAFEIDTLNKQFNAQVEFEPMYTKSYDYGFYQRIIRKIKIFFREVINLKSPIFLNTISYDYLWKRIINRKNNGEKTFLGAFVDWDNSARKGKNAFIVKNATPEKFEKYLTIQLEKAKNLNSEFIFINAWNEWAEGAYLEPDRKYGYKYLEAVKKAVDRNL